MKHSIQDFQARLQTGGVRPTMFEVLVTLPENNYLVGNGKYSETIRDFKFLCKGTSIPGSTTTSLTIGLPAGGALKVPGSRIFEPWSVKVITGGNMQNRRLFEQWSESIIGFEHQLSAQFLDRYMSTAEVTQLDRLGEPIRTYRLEHIFPLTISPQELSFDPGSTISEFDVQFQYLYFDPIQKRGGND